MRLERADQGAGARCYDAHPPRIREARVPQGSGEHGDPVEVREQQRSVVGDLERVLLAGAEPQLGVRGELVALALDPRVEGGAVGP